jgi:oligoribonuclease
MPQNPSNLIWIDLEMTGLNPNKDTIIEIATVVTDVNLNVVEEGPVLAIYHEDYVLSLMDEWNIEHHSASGLIARVQDSTISMQEAEKLTLAFLRKHVPPETSPICGNTICQDRRFLYRYMPDLENYFHYRHIDVSTLKELAGRWYPRITENFGKDSRHLALSDIYDSIAELKHYRKYFLRLPAKG